MGNNMENEKVKEIKVKEALETLCYKHKDVGSWEITKLQLMDILTLINDLERANERLKECYKVKAYDKLRAENKKLKDQIAELEEDKEKWQRKAINYYEKAKSYGIECIIDTDIDEKLKECLGK